ncbi:MAG: mannose-1-phosphate guanylyltransferase/mannose-6-phosphate isomerase [Parvularculaceae bacterium]|nr:mannose-1-phosphate guanylyltransferase/mannose-6-phosphate isomerase [Parvularculaceae bacterium]
MRVQPVILSGGAGTRLWPMSRKAWPKQFLALASEKTLFQEAALRVAPGPGPVEFAPPIVIGGAEHATLVAEQLAAIGTTARAIVAEPEGRNTAAAGAVAALLAASIDRQSLVLLLPADHHVADASGFRQAVADGAASAQAGEIVTFGVAPNEPHTGYGYIERAEAIATSVYRVRRFHEKPTREKAEAYLRGGAHFWNAGVFLFAPDAILEEFRKLAPEVLGAAEEALARAVTVGGVRRLDAQAFARCPSISIDYAVMEKTERAAVVAPLDVGWSDVGSWSAIAPHADDPRVFTLDAEGALVRTDGPFVGVIGVKDLVVVASGGAVLVAPRARAQDVKAIVDALKARGRTDLL